VGIDRIRTSGHVTAAVALDTVQLLAARVDHMLTAGRRITYVQRYLNMPGEITVRSGLTVDGKPDCWSRETGLPSRGYDVRLSGVGIGFGFAAYAVDGCSTEKRVWDRYHASEEHRNVTIVHLTGSPAGYGRDDRITIERWNRDSVGVETTVVFDPRDSLQEAIDQVADEYTYRSDQEDVSALNGLDVALGVMRRIADK
jgi:hypothetical protein